MKTLAWCLAFLITLAMAPSPLIAQSAWTWIAQEGSSFTIELGQTVRYGAGSSWIEKTGITSGQCTNAFFGADPLYGIVKSCEVNVPSTAVPPLPAGFQEVVFASGLVQPTALRFAQDGRLYVAEKRGVVKVFASLSDTAPKTLIDLRTNVYNFWDRGLLAIALHPNFPSTPYLYLLYTYDGDINGIAPKYGSPGVDSDPCPSPPGPTDQGCVVSGRLSRFAVQTDATGQLYAGPETVMISDWCQQFPSHSVGSLAFGRDGALYVSGGDGASFNFVDFGQIGNPCGDPAQEGGALRAQDLRTPSDPVGLGGTILRIDPETGAGLADNPFSTSPDANARRVIAYGLRNPFRINVRPGANNELWIGDVGWNTTEEINVVSNTTDRVARNFGWPCYEGTTRQSAYEAANLPICTALYAQANSVTPPFFAYAHSAKVVPNDPCPTGGSSISGLAFQFYAGAQYPPKYNGALFFADYTRRCIWALLNGTDGKPSIASAQNFMVGAANPVDLQISPTGEIFYADLNGGTIRRIQYTGSQNNPPSAVISATPVSGSAPLTVSFDGSKSTDPDAGDTLTYAWDLDGDGVFNDGSSPQAAFTFTKAGTYTSSLRVTDSKGAVSIATSTINVGGNTPPVAVIASPPATFKWKVGDSISFSGSASDAQDGALAASKLSWSVVLNHCDSQGQCHQHPQTSYPGVSSGTFVAPDHAYPSSLELILTATDSGGLTDTKKLRLDPLTTDLTFQTVPSGLQLVVGTEASVATFKRTVIVGSTNTVSAPAQVKGKQTMLFESWSDGGPQSHLIIAPAMPATFTARFRK
jgi:glucose/arabinose dehydrogenase